MDQWLVRTAKNRISGPYSRDQIEQMITKGDLELEDEVCQANSYWFSIHEQNEVRKFLKMDLPKPKRDSNEEVTETETSYSEEGPTDPQIAVPSRTSNVEERPSPQSTSALLSRGGTVMSRPSGSSLDSWKNLAWIFVVAVGFLVLVITKLLRH